MVVFSTTKDAFLDSTTGLIIAPVGPIGLKAANAVFAASLGQRNVEVDYDDDSLESKSELARDRVGRRVA